MTVSHNNSEGSTHGSVRIEDELNPDVLRAIILKMQDRERRLMELLNTTSPERIEHDLRNVLNELVLLRTLLEPTSGN